VYIIGFNFTQSQIISMANNFKFLSNRSINKIHLKLFGGFDGSSAYELLNVLKNCKDDCNQIFIDTNNINSIDPFGKDVFKKNLGVFDININKISITGKHRFSLR
jgi:hypothetical protein